jgi:hypothetical protein
MLCDRPNREGEHIPVGRRSLSTAVTVMDVVNDLVSHIVDPGPLWHHPTLLIDVFDTGGLEPIFN